MKMFSKLFEFLNPKTTPVIDNQYIKLKDLIGNKLSGEKDSNKFLKEYIKNTFSDHIYETCLLLTHLNGTYASYKEKILNSGNVDALLIKASDSEDNSIIEPGMSDKHLKRCEIYKENVRVYLAKALELKLKRVKNEILK